jgi:hypothetical protein
LGQRLRPGEHCGDQASSLGQAVVVVRLASLFTPSLKAITGSLGRRSRHTTEKAPKASSATVSPELCARAARRCGCDILSG